MRLVAVVSTTLAVTAIWTAPSAGAVTPPVVDGTRLPPAGPPTPPTPTVQSEPCVTVASTSDEVPPPPSAELAQVWALTRGAGQTVAVIDTGVARHRRLPHLLPGGDYVSTGDGTQDCDGHGTIVAGIVGAAPVDGFAFGGVAPDAAILSIRQSSNLFRPKTAGSGAGVGDVDTLAMAVRSAADAGATVINVSSVACVPAGTGIGDESLGAALAYAVDVKNVVVVAAAGNVGPSGQCRDQNPPSDPRRPGVPDWDGVEFVASPAWYDDYVLTVGSVDRAGRPSAFTLAGPWVDVAAPGEDVVSLAPSGDGLIAEVPGSAGGEPISGTSYAAPRVAGIAALVRATSPELTARQVMRRIEQTAHHPSAGWDASVGHGVVDALAAVSADGAGPAPEPTPLPTTPDPSSSPVPESGSRRVAFVGAAVCLGAAVTFSAVGSRRRRDPVADD